MSSSQNGIHDFLHLPYPRTLGGFKQGLVSANQYFDEGPVSGELATGLRDVYLQLCRVGEAGHDDIDLMPASHLSVLVCMRVAMAASVDVYKKKDGCVDPCFLAEKLAGVVVPEEQALHTRFDRDCAVSLFERLANFMGAYYYGQMPYANVDEYVTLVSSFFPGGGSFGFVDAEGQTSTEWSEYVETIHTNVLGRIVLKIDKDNARSISYSSKEVVKLPWPDMEELSPEILSEATDFNNCLKLGRKVDPTYISELDESTAVFKEGKLEVYPEGIPKGLEEWFEQRFFRRLCPAVRCTGHGSDTAAVEIKVGQYSAGTVGFRCTSRGQKRDVLKNCGLRDGGPLPYQRGHLQQLHVCGDRRGGAAHVQGRGLPSGVRARQREDIRYCCPCEPYGSGKQMGDR